jgi:hypothetical protein
VTALTRDELPDSTRILRRVHASQTTSIEGGSDLRPDSSCFKDKRGEPVSAYRADRLASNRGDAAAEVVKGHQEHGVASLDAGFLRDKGFEVHEDIDVDDETCGHAHVLIVGPKPHPVRVDLAEACDWEIRPPSGVED